MKNTGKKKWQSFMVHAILIDPRVNVIGQVAGKDRKYLPYIREGLGFYLCPADGQ